MKPLITASTERLGFDDEKGICETSISLLSSLACNKAKRFIHSWIFFHLMFYYGIFSFSFLFISSALSLTVRFFPLFFL